MRQQIDAKYIIKLIESRAHYLIIEDILDRLKESDFFDINAAVKVGKPIIYWAIMYARVDLLQLFLKEGARLEEPTVIVGVINYKIDHYSKSVRHRIKFSNFLCKKLPENGSLLLTGLLLALHSLRFESANLLDLKVKFEALENQLKGVLEKLLLAGKHEDVEKILLFLVKHRRTDLARSFVISHMENPDPLVFNREKNLTAEYLKWHVKTIGSCWQGNASNEPTAFVDYFVKNTDMVNLENDSRINAVNTLEIAIFYKLNNIASILIDSEICFLSYTGRLYTPLMAACSGDNQDAVEKLLKKNISVNAEAVSGNLIGFRALDCNVFHHSNVLTLKSLINSGAEVGGRKNKLLVSLEDNSYILNRICQLEALVMSSLEKSFVLPFRMFHLNNSVSGKVVSISGLTSLVLAVLFGKADAVKLLLQNSSAEDKQAMLTLEGGMENVSLLSLACMVNSTDVVSVLLDDKDIVRGLKEEESDEVSFVMKLSSYVNSRNGDIDLCLPCSNINALHLTMLFGNKAIFEQLVKFPRFQKAFSLGGIVGIFPSVLSVFLKNDNACKYLYGDIVGHVAMPAFEGTMVRRYSNWRREISKVWKAWHETNTKRLVRAAFVDWLTKIYNIKGMLLGAHKSYQWLLKPSRDEGYGADADRQARIFEYMRMLNVTHQDFPDKSGRSFTNREIVECYGEKYVVNILFHKSIMKWASAIQKIIIRCYVDANIFELSAAQDMLRVVDWVVDTCKICRFRENILDLKDRRPLFSNLSQIPAHALTVVSSSLEMNYSTPFFEFIGYPQKQEPRKSMSEIKGDLGNRIFLYIMTLFPEKEFFMLGSILAILGGNPDRYKTAETAELIDFYFDQVVPKRFGFFLATVPSNEFFHDALHDNNASDNLLAISLLGVKVHYSNAEKKINDGSLPAQSTAMSPQAWLFFYTNMRVNIFLTLVRLYASLRMSAGQKSGNGINIAIIFQYLMALLSVIHPSLPKLWNQVKGGELKTLLDKSSYLFLKESADRFHNYLSAGDWFSSNISEDPEVNNTSKWLCIASCRLDALELVRFYRKRLDQKFGQLEVHSKSKLSPFKAQKKKKKLQTLWKKHGKEAQKKTRRARLKASGSGRLIERRLIGSSGGIVNEADLLESDHTPAKTIESGQGESKRARIAPNQRGTGLFSLIEAANADQDGSDDEVLSECSQLN